MSGVQGEKQFFKIGRTFGDYIVVGNCPEVDKVKCFCKQSNIVVEISKDELKLAGAKAKAKKITCVAKKGERFKQLTVISEESTRGKRGEVLIKVKCDCGNEKYIKNFNFINGKVASCGCLHSARVREARTTHGLYKSKEYKTWLRIKTICFNENSTAFKEYGATGIEMYPQWVECFQTFYDDVGPSPKGTIITRIDPSRGFFPDNCCWVTRQEFQRISTLIKCGVNPQLLIQPKAKSSKPKSTISKSTITAIRREHAKGESNISILAQKYGVSANEIVNILISE